MNKFIIITDFAEKAVVTESERSQYLLSKAEKFAAAITIVTGYQLINLKMLLESNSYLVKGSNYVSLIFFGIALFLAFQSMSSKGYSSYPRGNMLLERLMPETVLENAAQEALAQLLLKTREKNAQLNDTKVKLLFWSSWLLYGGVVLIAGGQLLDALPFS